MLSTEHPLEVAVIFVIILIILIVPNGDISFEDVEVGLAQWSSP